VCEPKKDRQKAKAYKSNAMWKNDSAIVLSLSLLVLWLSAHASIVEAVRPTAALQVNLTNGTSLTMLVSQASFGSYPSMTPEKNPQRTLELPPSDNALLCDNVTETANAGYSGLMLVPRGTCTFQQKALNAQRLGATGIAIYGTLASRYSLNITNQTDYEYTQHDIVYPLKFFDYDCDKGRAEIPSSDIQMTPLPYNSEHNDPILSGPSSLCFQNSPDSLQNCPSQACLLTGQNTSGKLEACCAWDLHVWLYDDPTFTENNVAVVIPAVYLTMEQAQELLEEMSVNPVQAVLYTRYRPAYNMSAPLIWGLGVMVAALAAFLSASEYTSATKDIVHRMRNASTSSSASVQAGDRSSSSNEEVMQMSYQRAPPAEETLELSAEHALGFVVMASSGLFILFFFKVHILLC
jgi:hypothetical protein